MNKKKIRDALTGNEIEVIVSTAGKLYHIEGFSHAFITSVTLADLEVCRKAYNQKSQKAHNNLKVKSAK